MITTEGLLGAYYDCRRSKRRTASAIVYEMDYESRLIDLRDRVNARTYKPGRAYVCNRVLTNFIIAVNRLNAAKNLRQIRYAVCSINSYLGILRQCDEYANRRRILNMIEPDKFKYVYIKGHYEILALKKKYQIRTQTLKRIRDGDY